MVSSIGTHFTIRFPVSTPWMGVGVAFVMWLVSQCGGYHRPGCWGFSVSSLMSFNKCIFGHVIITPNNT